MLNIPSHPVDASAVSPRPAAAATTVSATDSARVQTLRGIACVLLVAYHVIGDSVARGLEVPDDSVYRVFSNIFIHLRMPLFTFLSGFVYAYRPVIAGDSWVFARKKLRRLLAPLLVVSTLYFVVQQLVPGTNTKMPWDEIWTIYLLPYNHFWFLQAIIILFAITMLLERIGWLKRFDGFLIIFALALVAHFTLEVDPDIFSAEQAAYLAPFFLAGLAANRFHDRLWKPPLKVTFAVVFFVTFSLHTLGALHIWGGPLDQSTPLATALSLSGIFVLMYWLPPLGTLGWLGAFSFTIYLYHVFFTAGTRVVLQRLGGVDLPVQALLGCTAGVLGPVFFEIAVRRSALARRWLLGQS
jgi:peptidoglycan/LPS O-acetylase OafA/YrhL